MPALRFLFDEDLTGVGALIQTARADVGDIWVIGRPPCPIAKSTPDEVWLPNAAQQRLVIFRIDRDVLVPGSAEHRAWHMHGCRGFILTIRQSRSSLWDQLRALVRQWDRITQHSLDRASDPSWIGKITANSVKPVV